MRETITHNRHLDQCERWSVEIDDDAVSYHASYSEARDALEAREALRVHAGIRLP